MPAHVIPCITGRPEGLAPADLAWFYGSIIQAGWSFQLAARARGLGSVWTTHHLDYEREAADVLGIPFDEVTQVALIPVAYTIGTDFKPAQAQPARDGPALADLVTPRGHAGRQLAAHLRQLARLVVVEQVLADADDAHARPLARRAARAASR